MEKQLNVIKQGRRDFNKRGQSDINANFVIEGTHIRNLFLHTVNSVLVEEGNTNYRIDAML